MKIRNKRLLFKQLWTILATIIALILINMFFNELCVNGLSEGFNIESYKEAFKATESDIKLFNIVKCISILATLCMSKECLVSNAEIERDNEKIEELERREMLCGC